MKYALVLFIFLLSLFSNMVLLYGDEKLSSLYEERRETILFGIDSQLKELIDTLKEEKNVSFNNELINLFNTTSNNTIHRAIIELFRTLESPELVELAYDLLYEDYFDMNTSTVISCIEYLKDFQNQQITDLFLELVEHDDISVANAAIIAIGTSDNQEYASQMLEYLEDTLFPHNQKPAIIEALGELKAEEAVDRLSEILTNEDKELSWRWRACIALGKIGGQESFNAIKNIFFDSDNILRSYAVQALQYFDDPEVNRLLMEGLRDSFWRVRVSSARSLGSRKAEEAIPILTYKVRQDPDIRNVRSASLEALAQIGGEEVFDFLREYYLSERNPLELRSLAITQLIGYDLHDSLDTIKELIKKEWEEENSRLLDHTCRELSLIESDALKDFYALMLQHPSFNLKLYGLRGIQRNKVEELKDEVKNFTDEGVHRTVRRLAVSVLETLE